MNYPGTTKKINTLGGLAVSVAAIATVVSGIWIALDELQVRPVFLKELRIDEENIQTNFKTVQVQIDSLNKFSLQTEWTILTAKLEQNGKLEFNDLQRYCKLAKLLEYTHIAVCGT